MVKGANAFALEEQIDCGGSEGGEIFDDVRNLEGCRDKQATDCLCGVSGASLPRTPCLAE